MHTTSIGTIVKIKLKRSNFRCIKKRATVSALHEATSIATTIFQAPRSRYDTPTVTAGSLVTLLLKVPSNAAEGTEYPLLLDASVFDGSQFRVVSTQPGRIIVRSNGGTIRGDLTGDGAVNLKDAVLALKIAVGSLAPTPGQIAAGDLAGADGRITIADASVILRLAVGL